MTEGQFLYDKAGRPMMYTEKKPLPEALPLNAKCPTCGNRHTKDLPTRNTSGKSVVTTKPVRCDDCDTTFEAELDEPIKYKMKKAPMLGDIRKGGRK
jgi:ribosomal protein S27E